MNSNGSVARRHVGPVTDYAGVRYVVLGTAVQTETGERFVVFRPAGVADPDADFYVLPERAFDDTVTGPDGVELPRVSAVRRHSARRDLVSSADDLLAAGSPKDAGLVATRALIDSQRSETIAVIAGTDGLEPGIAREIVSSAMAMLRVLDAAEREVDEVERNRPTR